MFDNEAILWWCGAASIVLFVGSFVLVPVLVVRMPSDYFNRQRRERAAWGHRDPVLRWVLLLGKNILGYLFIVVGIAMLVLPGQGLLSIMVGFVLIDFPGKYRIERWLIRRRYVLRIINKLRARYGRPQLRVSE